jgi:hypothetical protein
VGEALDDPFQQALKVKPLRWREVFEQGCYRRGPEFKDASRHAQALARE